MRERFEQCLLAGRIIPVIPDLDVISAEISESERDLEASERSFSHKDAKWTIIAAYSSLTHAYRALVMVKGYREKTDICLMEAIDALYVEEGSLDPAFLAGFREAKDLNYQALYEGVCSEPRASWMLQSAKAMHQIVKTLLPL